MPSASTIKPKLSFFFIVLLAAFHTSAQENSPFSRFGLGNTLPSRNIANMAMGGTSVAYVPFPSSQSINFNNPASYSSIRSVIYDLGLSLTSRTLKSATPTGKYNSVDLVPSYVSLGVPLDTARRIGLVFGLRPLTRISYSSQVSKTITGNGGTRDSILYVYEGDGGLYQAFAGIGKRWGNFSLGINTGYNFGRRENNTTTVVRDTAKTFNSHSRTSTSFSNLFLSGGLQYEANLSRTTMLRFGLAGNLKQELNGRQDVLRETFSFLGNGSTTPIDTISSIADKAGTIEMPVNYTAGISLIKTVQMNGVGKPIDKAFLSVEYESTRWSEFRFYNQAESLVNSWQVKVGGQFLPNPLNFRNFWDHVAFRGGFYFGRDAVIVAGKEMPVLGLSLGAGFPVRKWRSYDNQFTNINTAFEFGKRGNKDNNITESFFRFSVGFSLSDIWFIKRRYD